MGYHLTLLRLREISSHTPIIRKGRVYLNPGDKPPAGKTVKRGTQGGYYYEAAGNAVHITHPTLNKKLTYSDPEDHPKVEEFLMNIHNKKGGHMDDEDRLYHMSDESKKESADQVEREKKQDEHYTNSVNEKKKSRQFDHEKALPKVIQTFKKMYVSDWAEHEDYSKKGDELGFPQLYRSDEEAKSVASKIIKDIKHHSGDYKQFQNFVDSKIKDSSLPVHERDAYNELKQWYKHKTQNSNQPEWK